MNTLPYKYNLTENKKTALMGDFLFCIRLLAGQPFRDGEAMRVSHLTCNKLAAGQGTASLLEPYRFSTPFGFYCVKNSKGLRVLDVGAPRLLPASNRCFALFAAELGLEPR